jgi:hypothetical protein
MTRPLVLARFGAYSAHSEGEDRACVIGPDVNGRLCVMGRYDSGGRAARIAWQLGVAAGPLRHTFCIYKLD